MNINEYAKKCFHHKLIEYRGEIVFTAITVMTRTTDNWISRVVEEQIKIVESGYPVVTYNPKGDYENEKRFNELAKSRNEVFEEWMGTATIYRPENGDNEI